VSEPTHVWRKVVSIEAEVARSLPPTASFSLGVPLDEVAGRRGEAVDGSLGDLDALAALARSVLILAASCRAATKVRGWPISGSLDGARRDRSSGPRTSLAAAPPERRKRITQDLNPLGWITKNKERLPASRTNRRLPGIGLSFSTAA